MARERWFYAPTHKRLGPMPLAQLVEGLLRLPDPRTCLVWKHGLPAWTPAGDVVDVDRHLAPFVAARKPPARVERPAEVTAEAESAATEQARARTASRAKAAAGPTPVVYAGAAAGVLALGALVWLFWPKAPVPRPNATGPGTDLITPLRQGGPSAAPAAGTTGTSGAAPGQAGFAGWSDQEGELPPADLAKLKAVAGWTGRSLEMTIYNGGSWRITELKVRPRRLVKGDFVDDEQPLTLLPIGAQMSPEEDQIMNRLVTSKGKPGVSPLDTGKFAGVAGDRPEAFGATIIGARGYPPR